jgi:hypothetical protein
MAWIETPSPQASKELRATLLRLRPLLPPVYNQPPEPGRLPESVLSESIVLSHALLPQVLEPIFLAQTRLMAPELPLSRREHELIAATVSALNDCFY